MYAVSTTVMYALIIRSLYAHMMMDDGSKCVSEDDDAYSL